MKNLVKISCVAFAVIAFASCRKTEFSGVTPSTGSAATVDYSTKAYHDGSLNVGDGGTDLLADKDKCKKCHGNARTMDLDWNAPYMADGRYSSLEELIDNFDFVNEVHLPVGATKTSTISKEQRQSLLSYLESIATSTSVQK